MGNKVKFGLKNVYYSVISEALGVVAYGTPARIPGAVNLSLSAAGEKVKFPADDIEDYFSENTNNGYDGSLEMALIPDHFRTDVLGDEVDSNGALIENANATVKRFALLYEFDGDVNKTRHVMYNVLANRPKIEGATRSNKKEPKSETLDIEARPAVDTSDVKAKVKQGDVGYDTFFSAVYLKNAPTNTVEEATTDTEFDKYDPADIAIDVTSTDVTNTVKNVLLDGVPIAGVNLTVTGVDVAIAQAVFAGLDEGDHTVAVEFTKGNSVAVTVTVTDTTP
jgi:phi13 family phage major tail protein